MKTENYYKFYINKDLSMLNNTKKDLTIRAIKVEKELSLSRKDDFIDLLHGNDLDVDQSLTPDEMLNKLKSIPAIDWNQYDKVNNKLI